MLGDYLPDKLKAEAAKRITAGVGAVVYYYQINTTPPKDKYCIIIGISACGEKIGVVYINTNGYAPTPYLMGFQIPILQSEYSWLRYNSYIDSSILIEKNKNEIDDHIQRSVEAYYKGEISSDLINQIKGNLGISRRMSPALRAKYGII